MSSVVNTRKTPPPEMATIKPHDDLKKPKVAAAGKDTEIVPEDANIPDNYVAWTLKNQKALPPITWSNVFENVNWLSTAVLLLTPAITFWGAMHTKLRWETAVWSVMYYFITGLGALLWSLACHSPVANTAMLFRYHCRLPPSLGPSLIQCFQASPILPRYCRCRSRRRFHQMVVPRSPCPPSLYRHRVGSIQCSLGFLVGSYWLDDLQASQETRCG